MREPASFGVIGIVFAFVCIACGGGGGTGGSGGPDPVPDPVDLILNAVDVGSHDTHWHLAMGGSYGTADWAFFANGTGRYRQGIQAPDGVNITWIKLGPDALSVSGLAGYQGVFTTWSDISGSVSAGTFTVILDGNPTARTLTLVSGSLGGSGVPTSGEIYCAEPTSTTIRVRDRVTLASLRSISGGLTELSVPTGLGVHGGRGEIFVANAGTTTVTVHGTTDSGNVAPLRVIAGASTGLAFAASVGAHGSPFNGLYVDEVNGEIGVVNNAGTPSITIYGVTDSGNVVPKRMIQGASTLLSGPIDIDVDTVNNEIFVTEYTAKVRVFGRLADGDVAPLRTLDTWDSQSSVFGVTVDPGRGELWVSGNCGGTQSHSLSVYARTAGGTTPPIRGTGGCYLQTVVDVDRSTGEVVVCNGRNFPTLEVLAGDLTLLQSLMITDRYGGVAFGP